ncbi:MAG: zinc ribbon domain-containing protein, partial [Tenericutes bacterium]|nr:zinc ribbon domain-containing protein [Mycoplasmatota bacterium]
MYCSKCGNQLMEGDKICTKCGTLIANNNQSFNNQANNPPYQQFQTQNQNYNNMPQNNNGFDIKKYLPYIIAVVAIIIVIIVIIILSGKKDDNLNNNNNDNGNNIINNNNNNNNNNDKVKKNYKVTSPASENDFKSLSFEDGEKYLRNIGFSDIQSGRFAYENYDKYDYDGYTARYSPYGFDFDDDKVEIIFKENKIFLCSIQLSYLEKDMDIDTVYNDLSNVMSAFNGYKLDKAKLLTAFENAKNNNDFGYSSKYGFSTYFIGSVGFEISITIRAEEEYRGAGYIFEI